tara:strand:+ start:536 stop:796 length:261 start_codon:yes stop_codon:yes gene_type:complete
MNDNRPGYKTTEFYLTLACLVCTIIVGSGLVAETSQIFKLLSAVASALTVLGYSHSRGSVKSASIGLEAIKMVSEQKKTKPDSMGN